MNPVLKKKYILIVNKKMSGYYNCCNPCYYTVCCYGYPKYNCCNPCGYNSCYTTNCNYPCGYEYGWCGCC